MIDILRQEINISDKVKLYLTTGKEVIVSILDIGEKHLLVENEDGTQSRFFENLIGGWDLINKKDNTNDIICEKTENKSLGKSEVISHENKVLGSDESTQNLSFKEDDQDNLDLKLVGPLKDQRIGIKILGSIDLDKIEPKRKRFIPIKKVEMQISSAELSINKPSNLREHISQHNRVFKSFDNLNVYKDEIKTVIARKLIPANATIKRFGQNYQGAKFGFLTDNDKNDYYFSFSDIFDEDLKELLIAGETEGIQVICVLKTVAGRNNANSIYLPKTIENFQSIAENYFQNKEFIYCQNILSFILNTVYDFEPSLNLKSKVVYELSKKKITSGNAASIYLLAKKELRKGNNEYGKKLLLELIETPNFKSETALKELAYELQREGKIDDSIELVLKFNHLIKTSDPNSLLAYFYETKKDYTKAISFLEKIKPKTPLERIRVDKRLAIDFFQINDYITSEEYLRKVIEKQSNDIQSQKLLDALEKIKLEGISDDIETIFNEAELSSLSGGRSPLIKFALDNCDYAGVPSSNIIDEKFNKTTIGEIRRLIEKNCRFTERKSSISFNRS